MIKNILYILIITSLWAPLALAASPAFTTYPSHTFGSNKWITRDVNPGQNYQEAITVENLLDEPIHLNVEIIESTGTRENIQLLENQSAQSIGQWISPETKSIDLGAHEKKDIQLNMQIPQQVKLGQYQAVALVSYTQKNSGLNIATRVGDRIYLNVTNQSILQTNTFTPGISTLQIAFIIFSLAGIAYGILPARKLTNQKSLS